MLEALDDNLFELDSQYDDAVSFEVDDAAPGGAVESRVSECGSDCWGAFLGEDSSRMSVDSRIFELGEQSPFSIFSGAGCDLDSGVGGSIVLEPERYGGVSAAEVSGVETGANSDFEKLGDLVQNTESANFRLQGKCFHLTYKGFVPREYLLDLFRGSDVQWYSVCWERGAGTPDEPHPYDHTHFYVRTVRRVDKSGPRCCDWSQGPNHPWVHPFIQKVTQKIHEGRLYHKYHRKGPVQLWQSETGPEDIEARSDLVGLKRKIFTGSLLESCVSLGIEIRSVADVKAIREERLPPAPSRSEFDKSEFNLSLSWSVRWCSEGKWVDVPTDCIFLYGGAGLGKTERAVAEFSGEGLLGPLLVRSLDDARFFNPDRYSGIVFDDCSLADFTAEQKISIVDTVYGGRVKCRYSDGILPPGTKRIFTSNLSPEEYWRTCKFGSMPDQQWEALKRRVKFIHIIGPTWATPVGPLINTL